MIEPVISISEEEHKKGFYDQKKFENAAKLFVENGCLVIKNAIDSEYISQLHDIYVDQYKSYLDDREYDTALKVGDKRTMITVEFSGAFNNPALYANPFVLGIIQAFLSESCILGSFGSVTALPGAEVQHVHRDHPDLFLIPQVDQKIPPFAITAIVPLVDTTEENGSTRMWLGSHTSLERNVKKVQESMPTFDPLASRGDIILFDYRTIHGGLANNSGNLRPILYNVYYRPWFRDCVNYKKQVLLDIRQEEFEKIPAQFRFLFDWI